jgi:hypothetical protein
MDGGPGIAAQSPERWVEEITRLARAASSPRLLAMAAPLAFAILAATLAAAGAISAAEALWASVSVVAAFGPSGWLDCAGWNRRGAEALLAPVAIALTLIDDPTMRRMLLPPLLVLAALAAAAAALRRSAVAGGPLLLSGLALAVRCAGGLGLVGAALPLLALAVAVPVLVARTAARWQSRTAAVAVVLLAGVLPFERHFLLAITVALAAIVAAMASAPTTGWQRLASGWLPGITAVTLVAAALAPWGGLAPAQAFPAAGWLGVVGVLAAAVATPLLPPAAAGAVWLALTFVLGPAQPAPPDRAQLELNAANPVAALPPGNGGTYIAEINLANAPDLRQDTVVAFIELGKVRIPVRAGREAAEWAHERSDVTGRVRHALPDHPVWRPAGIGASSLWSVWGQLSGGVPKGLVPVIRRQPSLPSNVAVAVATAGPSVPSPPRDWPLPAWLLAAAAAVALLQGIAGTWRSPGGWLPWALLTAGSLVARMPVEPLRLLGERYSVDVALAALLVAWWPAARGWLRQGRVVPTALALLLPVALAAPHLTPPVGDEAYHLLLLKSLRSDFDLDLSNNYDVEHHPENLIFVTPKGWYLHSPVLAMLLLPGYFLAGRYGAVTLLAVAAALAVWMLARRARELGVPPRRVNGLAVMLLLSYPLATYVAEIWPELPGIFLACVALTLTVLPRPRPVLASLAAVLSAWIKTRLALVTVPLAVAGWLPRPWSWSWRGLRRIVLPLALTAAAGLALSVIWFGNALDTVPGRRQASHLIPHSARQVVTSIAGLALDPAGGLAFSAPLLLVALAGVPLLWRRGTDAERALLVGGALTLASQLSNREWRGGDSPPARYLVTLLPVFALAGAMLLRSPRRWRAAASFFFVPSLVVWWVFVSRPHLAFNSGDGGFWLSDRLATRFEASARHLFPSFLRPDSSTLAWPFIAAGVVAAVLWAASRRPALIRVLSRCSLAALLLLGAGLAADTILRYDRVIELEDPQIVPHGGMLYPPPGQMSRFVFRNGWRLHNMESVDVPVHAPGNATLELEGWLEGESVAGARIAAQWRDGGLAHIPVQGSDPISVPLPPPPSAGKHWLRLTLIAPRGGSVVLDKIYVGF